MKKPYGNLSFNQWLTQSGYDEKQITAMAGKTEAWFALKDSWQRGDAPHQYQAPLVEKTFPVKAPKAKAKAKAAPKTKPTAPTTSEPYDPYAPRPGVTGPGTLTQWLTDAKRTQQWYDDLSPAQQAKVAESIRSRGPMGYTGDAPAIIANNIDGGARTAQDFVAWLASAGKTTKDYFALPPAQRESLYRHFLTGTTLSEENFPYLARGDHPANENALAGRKDIVPRTYVEDQLDKDHGSGSGTTTDTTADPATAANERAKALADLARAGVEHVFAFQDEPFLRNTDEVAAAQVDAIAISILGRQLRPEERVKALAAYRDSEHKVYTSTRDLNRVAAAQKFIADMREHGQSWTAIATQLATQLRDDPSFASATADEISAAVDDAIRTSPEYKTAASYASRDNITAYTKDDLQLHVQNVAADLAPTEAAGSGLREAFDAYLKAVAGQVNQQSFMPSGGIRT